VDSGNVPRRRATDPTAVVLSVFVAAGLVVEAVVHLRLAHDYQLAQPAGIGQGNLFRVEAVIALLAAGYLLVRRSRLAFTVAAAVGLAGLVAVIVYRYFQVPAIGPIPSMYEPIWFFSKSLSAVAEAVVAVLAGFAAVRRHPQPADAAAPKSSSMV
jgi:hypothetical protein